MQRASEVFSDEQRRRVNEAVASAEAETSAELVPVVATASGRYDRAEDIVGLWFSIIAVIGITIFFRAQAAPVGDWEAPSPFLQLLSIVSAMIVAFIIGAVIGNRVGWLRRLFTPRQEMRDDVASSARRVFFDHRVHHTNEGSGILFYVSLFERVASVIADQQVIEQLGQATLDDLCAELTKALHQGETTDALCQVLASAGDRLAEALPRSDGDRNELSDALVTID